MKLSVAVAIGVVLTLSASQASAQHTQDHESGSRGEKASFVFIGTLIDATWFTPASEGPEGEDRITRATNKMVAGSPAAVLPEGTEKPEEIWYLLTNPAPLAPYAGKQIKVEGRGDRSIRAIDVTTLYVRDGDEWREVQIWEAVQKGVPPQKAETSHEEKKAGSPSDEKHRDHGAPTGEGHRDHEEARDDEEGAKNKHVPQHEHGRGTTGEQKNGHGQDHGHEPGLHDLLTPPPAHPILVNFTAGLFPAALLADWLGRLLRRKPLYVAGWWMLLFAAIVTPFTVLAGWDWFRQVGDMGHWQMTIHPWLGSSLAILIPTLAVWRRRFHVRDEEPSRRYLVCATILLLALILQGHLGGTMSFRPHGQQAASAAGHAH